jgi:hypothetical protein
MAHWDLLSDKNRVATMKPGPTGLHPYLDNLVRLSKVPVATISALEQFTDQFARRIAAFDKVAVSGIKQLVDVASLPSEAELAAGFRAYYATSGRPVNAPFVQTLFELGLQQPDGIEREFGAAIGRLRQETPRASRPG